MNLRRYNTVKEAIESFLSQSMTEGELITLLQKQYAEIEQGEAQAKSVQMPPEVVEDFAAELEAGFVGIQMWKEGLTGLLESMPNPTAENFQPFLEQCRQGSVQVNQALQLNEQTQNTVESMMIESASDF